MKMEMHNIYNALYLREYQVFLPLIVSEGCKFMITENFAFQSRKYVNYIFEIYMRI